MINKFLSQNKTNKGERTILDKFILSDKLVGHIEKNLDLDNRTEVLLIAEKLHVADVAELIKKIKPEYKKSLIDLLRVSLNPEVLSKLDDSTLNTVIQQIGSKKTAEALEISERTLYRKIKEYEL